MNKPNAARPIAASLKVAVKPTRVFMLCSERPESGD
jgi:hypothetical protein